MRSADIPSRQLDIAGVHIRLATAGDLPAMEWEGAYTHFRRLYAKAFERARRGMALLWVAELEPGALLGQLFVLLKNNLDPDVADGRRRAFLHSFRVRPEFRRAGLGTRLMHTAEADLRTRGFRQTYLHVALDNREAIRFYERLGYQRLSEVSGDWFYEDHEGLVRQVNEPGWRMGKAIKNNPGEALLG